MRMKWLIAPLAAAALVVGGCAGGGDETTAPETPTPTAGETDTPEPSATTEAETAPTQPGGEGTGTDDEQGGATSEPNSTLVPDDRVDAAVEAFLAKHEGAERMDTEEAQAADPAELEGLEVEPPECAEAVRGANSTDLVSGAVVDGAVHMDLENYASRMLIVIDFPDAERARASMDALVASSEECPTMTITTGEVTTTGSVELEPLEIPGAELAYLQVSNMGDDEYVQTTYYAYALVGDLIVSGMSTGPDPTDGARQAEETVTDAAAALG